MKRPQKALDKKVEQVHNFREFQEKDFSSLQECAD
jgi:hypothetical protein